METNQWLLPRKLQTSAGTGRTRPALNRKQWRAKVDVEDCVSADVIAANVLSDVVVLLGDEAVEKSQTVVGFDAAVQLKPNETFRLLISMTTLA